MNHKRMKITAGLGSVDDYIPFCRAGADELFAGVVPSSWMEGPGMSRPLNRREVLYYNVQLGSVSELEILADMRKDYGVPVTITMNSPFYDPEDFPLVEKAIDECLAGGFSSFIIADPALILYLKGKNISIHLSGEAGEANHYLISAARGAGVKRIIFQRKCTPFRMKKMLDLDRAEHPDDPIEAEAFLLNERCQFTGAYCNSFHCDELAPACRIPYRLSGSANVQTGDDSAENQADDPADEKYLTGRGGCGLCALWKLREAGVSHLKIVSRGNYSEDTLRDILAARRALDILEDAADEKAYVENMKRALFPSGCSGCCYY